MKTRIFPIMALTILSFPGYADVYDDLARATGGTSVKMTKDEFMKSVNDGENRYSHLRNAQPIFIQNLSLKQGELHTISFPVDSRAFGSMVSEVQGLESARLVMRSSAGQSVSTHLKTGPADSPVEITRDNFRAIIVPSPASGMWSISVLGPFQGKFSVRLQSESSVREVRFVERSGRPGHEGLFPISGQVKRGRMGILELRHNLGTNISDVLLVDEYGNTVSSGSRLSSDTGDSAYYEVKVPNAPFRVLIKGQNFQRITSALFEPQ